ncbi:DegT/DnrJ/EryC1/StrS family aminotransferase [Clostridium algidicarnis]|uniref:DegT/DnrJ/EryC1/StrS family aminotransferase n=1 Tax=Clostridium algidicarnis TaxID=37659 RepID=A0ABS6C5A6_9CLOT|nr:DegT/DnrJ/EryC1/StrS family aminotransferase [Clostridium algidicarnis]
MDRDELLRRLNNENIQTRPLWGLIHKQKSYLKNQGYKIEKSLFYEKNLINVPCSSNLEEEDIVEIIEFIIRNGS